ncbi:glycosyl hydrolase family 35 [Colletotrichum karsti]|uniref:Beta-galactosidase n=1 Tax=Colletotrichum karsti TaxID=1095194 RepID=A0A9P6HW36_9PEZI|nr:glycosyl hydrolase family 35 [Colletotrichum karsti]KAF9871549.1 glycosyl hydrolase family 35 [Colletotrichum karsti]
MRLPLLSIASLALGLYSFGGSATAHPSVIDKRQLQDIVTWDEQSLFVRGERVMIFSGEIHPFRLPVASLYLDLFQKVKALGLNTVSFYVDWALLEGKAGNVNADGIFDLQPFFDAASKAGIYLIARPGPYINAEVSGGGFPGWLARSPARLRTSDPEFLSATDNYMVKICDIIAKAQITNGGPVILFQPENEYTNFVDGQQINGQYFQYVIDQARNAGVVVPMISNDARPAGHNAPGTGVGEVDIYGYDGYPLGFDCGNPGIWPADKLPTNYRALHLAQSPSTPNSIMEFQGGSFDPWGGHNFEQCAALVNYEFERVFYKNNLAAGVSIFNVYMLFGGTNWGNLGHPGGYTSYDYGASITEDRSVAREKYSEMKLEAQFLKVSPSYLTAKPGNLTTDVYATNYNLAVTPLRSNISASYFVVRHANYSSLATTEYTLRLPTSQGTIAIPQFREKLQLNGRDSKIHVVDYPVGNKTLLYSTAEIFTWKKFTDKTVLLVYGGPGETHEMAIKKTTETPFLAEGSDVDYNVVNGNLVLTWKTSEQRRVVQVDDFFIYILDRNSAYNYWVPDLLDGANQTSYGSSIMNPDALIVRGGYLVRSLSAEGDTLKLQADFNQTSDLEIIGADSALTKLEVNGKQLDHTVNDLSNWIVKPSLSNNKPIVPDLVALRWTYVDSLPEILAGYDDSAWPLADHTTSNNTVANVTTTVSLFASDYGFHAGSLIYRGYFTASGDEITFNVTTQGGAGFASSVWLNESFLGSFTNGPDASGDNTASYNLTSLNPNATYVLTILVDTMGLEENFYIATDMMKTPRGVIDYNITSPTGSKTNVTTWKITGNLGGEDYADHFRGPLNEGGLFFERQGYHIPTPQDSAFTIRSPYDGTHTPGVSFYAANLTLDLPWKDLDIPLSFVFDDITNSTAAYRAILYVNGFQYGKYVSNIGPQTKFPVPEGILNYNGNNWIGLAFWALEEGGATLQNFRLEVGNAVTTAREEVKFVEGPAWTKRTGAY